MRITLTKVAAKTLPELINEFITRKKADGLRDRTLNDYYKELSKFAATTSSVDENDLRHAVINYFAAIPDTSAAIHSKTKGFDRNYSSNQVRQLAAARLVAEIDKMAIL